MRVDGFQNLFGKGNGICDFISGHDKAFEFVVVMIVVVVIVVVIIMVMVVQFVSCAQVVFGADGLAQQDFNRQHTHA